MAANTAERKSKVRDSYGNPKFMVKSSPFMSFHGAGGGFMSRPYRGFAVAWTGGNFRAGTGLASGCRAKEWRATHMHTRRLQAVQPRQAGRHLRGPRCRARAIHGQVARRRGEVREDELAQAHGRLHREVRHRRRRHFGHARPAEACVFHRCLHGQRQGADHQVRERQEIPDRRRYRQAERDRHRESRRQQRTLRPRQFQAGEDRHLQRQHR